MPADKILRAGPFGQSADSFVEEPVSAVYSTVPINCAMDDTSSTWVWRHYQNVNKVVDLDTVSDVSTYEDDLVDVAETTSAGGHESFFMSTFNTWRYQAYVDFTMSVTFDLSSDITDGYGGEAFVTITIIVDGEKVEGNDLTDIYGVTYYDGQPFILPNFESAALSMTVDVDCPSTDGEPPKLIEIVCTTQMNVIGAGSAAEGAINVSIADTGA